MTIIIFLIILLVLVLVHEFGHCVTAKKFGIRVDEFGFGFPPKIFSIKKGETEYSLNALPFGGFVKIFGENPDAENTTGPDANRSFVNKPRWQQAIVLFAGVFMNFVLAWVLFSVSFMSGLPMSLQNAPSGYELKDTNLLIVSVLKDSPAEIAGLEAGDKVVYLANREDNFLEAPNITPEKFKEFISENSGEDGVEVGYLRGRENKLNTVEIVPKTDSETGSPLIGV